MRKQLKQLYGIIPYQYMKVLKNIPDRVLYGNSYLKWRSKISFDKHVININLYNTLNYVREHTKFGADYIPDRFTINDSIRVLEDLPLVSSYDLATNLKYYVSDEFNSFNSYFTTTGGTGRNPTKILLSNELYGIEWAHVHHSWAKAGYSKKKHLKLTLRGISLKGDKLAEYNPIYNELVVDIFKIKEYNFQLLYDVIKKYDIKYIHGYPSLVKEYMEYFQKYNVKLNLNGILLASEGVSVTDKIAMSQFFNCKVISFYGQTERALMALDENANGMYKIYTSYGFPRVINGELVITSFVNRALPLVNYKVGDGASLIDDGQYLYITGLTSRWGKDFIYLDEKKKIPAAAINLHSEIQSEILYYQIHQREFGRIEIRILQRQDSKIDPQRLIRVFGGEMRKKLRGFDIDINLVSKNDIIRSKRGKVMLLVQDLNV